MTTYFVNEIFTSLQGEGYWTGKRATFIRLQGCTVGCPWCDSGPDADKIWGRQTNGLTRNTWARGGKKISVNSMMELVDQHHVVITGGEPTLYNLDELISALEDKDCYTQIETSGQQWLKGDLRVDWVTWSPKGRLNWDAPEQLIAHANEVKFVVEPILEYSLVSRLVKYTLAVRAGLPTYFYFMPEGTPPKTGNNTYAVLLMDRLIADAVVDPSYIRFGDRLQYRLGIR
jgi:7-carboxy-7-deazaguanine synthase